MGDSGNGVYSTSFLLLAIFATALASQTSNFNFNAYAGAPVPPSIEIIEPQNLDMFSEGVVISFSGTASDPKDGSLSGFIEWTEGKVILGSGTTTTSSFSPGIHVITASVTNTDGVPNNDTVEISINGKPIIDILQPKNGEMFSEGEDILFSGDASDLEDGPLSGFIEWTEGKVILGSGTTTTSSFSPGIHVITASVTDSKGLANSAMVEISIKGIPVVSINSPFNGDVFTEGEIVSFAGTASDAEDGNITAKLSWVSSEDGAIGNGASFDTSLLSAGTHSIIASVTDSDDITTTHSIDIRINAKPTVSINSPSDGDVFTEGEIVSFAGTASDAEDGNITDDLSWVSSEDGAIGNGASFDTSLLSAGTHSITASVTDSDGATSQEEITLTILTPKQKIEAIIDLVDNLVDNGDMPKGTGNSITASFQAALGSLDKDNSNSACGQLGAAINKVDAKSGKSISEEISNRLVLDAETLIEVLGCKIKS